MRLLHCLGMAWSSRWCRHSPPPPCENETINCLKQSKIYFLQKTLSDYMLCPLFVHIMKIMLFILNTSVHTTKTHTVLSRASAHGCSQLKCRVGCYTEKVLKWFNYPRARAHLGCKVSCQGIPHRLFARASSKPAWQWRKLYRATKLTDS